jgi:hypothetical protein
MDELDRIFQQVVREVAALGPDRLVGPIQVAELYQELVPYRQFRNTLRFDSYQDYEMALLRLLAGERGYATVEPPEASEALLVESQATYPDPGVVREFAAARAYLDPVAARSVLAGTSAYAPPESTEAGRGSWELDAEHAEPTVTSWPRPASPPTEPCPYCGAHLPEGRPVFYCPFCGGNVRGVTCPECHAELEVGWIFCVTCGRKTGRT